MTVSSRPRLIARIAAPALVVFIVALAGIVTSGCEDKHIGRKCDLAISGAGGTMEGAVSATINSQAVECPTRLCLRPAEANGPVPTESLCSSECGSDDDCADGQTGVNGTGLCQTGFKCAIPTTVGPFCCKRMCVCKDFLVAGTPFTVPPVCMAGSGGTCVNVH